MDSITVGQVIASIVAIGSLVGAVKVIIDTISKPLKEMQVKLQRLEDKMQNIEDKVESMKTDFSTKLDILDKHQDKQSRNMHMQMITTKYLLDCSTDNSSKGQEIRNEYSSYLITQAASRCLDEE